MRPVPRLVAARSSSARRVLAALSVVASVGLTGVLPAAVAQAADVTITLDGHGNGHGVGLSQWGAYGYAVDLGWTSAQIVDHYFGGTVAGTVALDTPVRVRLQNLDNAQTAVAVDDGSLVVDGLAGGPWKSVLVRETATNGVFAVWARADTSRCPATSGDPAAAGWALVNGAFAGDVAVHTAVDSTTVTSYTQMISTCEPSSGTVRWYRGTIRATNDSFGANRTLNVLPVEQYLRTVIAMEMSPGWADDGGGRGAQALQAQAIAARGYALAYRAATPSYTYADLCDMVCQSYFGVAFRTAGGTFRQVENAATDAAVVATAGVVRFVTGSNPPAIALTMFSASNGGWTATNNHPLTPFPAVQDDGDGTALNPRHSWSVTLSGAAIALKYPAIGTFTDLTVNTRNGYGEWGGRVLSLTLTGTAGAVSVSGADFRSRMGLTDTWFNVRGATDPPVPATDCGSRIAPAVTGTLPAPKGTLFSPIAPVRLVDTRTGLGTEAAPLGAGCTMVVATGRNPASVRAVVVNLTAVKAAGAGAVVAYACGTAQPSTATMRLAAGRTTSTTAVVPLGADGTICITSSATVPLVVDLFGAYSTLGKYRYQPVSPARLYDSRPTGLRVRSGTTLKVKVAGTPRVPLGAAGAAFTVHATGATSDGYLVVYACTATRPAVTSMSVNAGVDASNHVETAISGTGQVCIFVGGSAMHVTVDVSGWFGSKATTRLFVAAPSRVVDTSKNVGLTGGFTAGQNRAVALAGKAGMPAAATLKAVLATVTVSGATRNGWVTVHPCVSPVPSVSSVRFGAGSAAVAVAAGADDAKGRWCLSANTALHVTVDVGGWYA